MDSCASSSHLCTTTLTHTSKRNMRRSANIVARPAASLLKNRPTTSASVSALAAARAFSTTGTVRNAPEALRTPLYDFHLENKARMVPFAGWNMPLSYGEVGQGEHFHRRRAPNNVGATCTCR